MAPDINTYTRRSSFLKEFIVSLFLLIPLSIWCGAVYAFKFCGPIYRCKKFFVDRLNGRWDGLLTLRKGDDLRDVKDAINAAMDLMNRTIRSQHQILMEVRAVMQEPLASFQREGKTEDLISRIDKEASRFAQRFGASETPATPLLSYEPPVAEKALRK